MMPLALVGLMKSPWAKGAALIFLGLACLVGVYAAGHRAGSREATTRMEASARKALEIADTKLQTLKDSHAKQMESLRVGFARVDSAEDAKASASVSAIAGDTKRVRFKSARCVPVPAAGTSAPGTDGAIASTELLPDDGKRIYGIAVVADNCIRRERALQAWAKEAVKLCSGDVTK